MKKKKALLSMVVLLVLLLFVGNSRADNINVAQYSYADIDFYNVSHPERVQEGELFTVNCVIENTGPLPAINIEVYLDDGNSLEIQGSTRFDLNDLEDDEKASFDFDVLAGDIPSGNTEYHTEFYINIFYNYEDEGGGSSDTAEWIGHVTISQSGAVGYSGAVLINLLPLILIVVVIAVVILVVIRRRKRKIKEIEKPPVITTENICPSCGSPVDPEAEFCGECGAKF